VGIDDFIYVLENGTERYIKKPNVQTDKLLDVLSK
jgi:phage repressor protein C with HTH and peptisase S24 domain